MGSRNRRDGRLGQNSGLFVFSDKNYGGWYDRHHLPKRKIAFDLVLEKTGRGPEAAALSSA